MSLRRWWRLMKALLLWAARSSCCNAFRWKWVSTGRLKEPTMMQLTGWACVYKPRLRHTHTHTSANIRRGNGLFNTHLHDHTMTSSHQTPCFQEELKKRALSEDMQVSSLSPHHECCFPCPITHRPRANDLWIWLLSDGISVGGDFLVLSRMPAKRHIVLNDWDINRKCCLKRVTAGLYSRQSSSLKNPLKDCWKAVEIDAQ